MTILTKLMRQLGNHWQLFHMFGKHCLPINDDGDDVDDEDILDI